MVLRCHGVLFDFRTHPWDVGSSQIQVGTLGAFLKKALTEPQSSYYNKYVNECYGK